MNIRILLLPFSFIYGFVVLIRNKCYDFGLFHSEYLGKGTICIGNLSVGGTGKTPHVDLLVQMALEKNLNVAVLSRGYGRKTKGVREVLTVSKANEVGDEPLMYKIKHGKNIKVFVSEKRIDGVREIRSKYPGNQLIILDDAFQHRAVKADFNILITEFKRPFFNDFLLPAGNLREPRSGVKRADIVVVSKCSERLPEEVQQTYKDRIKNPSEKVFFSRIEYGKLQPFFNQGKNSERNIEKVLLVTGIANPLPLKKYLEKKYEVIHLPFGDHHNFSSSEIADILQKFDTFACSVIVTTEKDFMRLKDLEVIKKGNAPWYYLPIEIVFESETFKKEVYEYYREI